MRVRIHHTVHCHTRTHADAATPQQHYCITAGPHTRRAVCVGVDDDIDGDAGGSASEPPNDVINERYVMTSHVGARARTRHVIIDS